MAKVTYVFGVLLMLVGLVGYFGTGSAHPTALIPIWFGLALGVCGFLAISPSEGRRKLFMHINVTIGSAGLHRRRRLRPCMATAHARSLGIDPDYESARGQADHGHSPAHLCESLRALLHRSAPLAARYNAWADFAAVEWEWACAPSARRTGASARAGQADLPKPKPNLRKIWPEVKALVAPRKGLILAGCC